MRSRKRTTAPPKRTSNPVAAPQAPSLLPTRDATAATLISRLPPAHAAFAPPARASLPGSDLKPSNLIVAVDAVDEGAIELSPTLRLADFGSAVNPETQQPGLGMYPGEKTLRNRRFG
eukprot:1319662-Pleurochrysis_carterae.AAC.1